MSADDYSLNPTDPVSSEQIDLSLPIPGEMDLPALFPRDRILRLHPNWFVNEFDKNGDQFTASVKDYVSEATFPVTGSIVYRGSESDILTITIEAPSPILIRFFLKNESLHVQTFSDSEILRDDPLLLWIRAIREYLRLYVKITPVTLAFRLLMNRMVLQMNPSQRKICMMLAKITAVEILVIILIIVGYKIFVL